jgi:hypothetical protein
MLNTFSLSHPFIDIPRHLGKNTLFGLVVPFTALLAIILNSTACTNARTVSKSGVSVSGGIEHSGFFREAVGLKVTTTDLGENFCTGTIVRHDLILTAAHCFDKGPNKIKVEVFDSPDSAFTAKKLTSTAILIFPTYDPKVSSLEKVQNDVAFVVFPSGSFGDRVIGKVAKNFPVVNQEVNYVGYGSKICSTPKFVHKVGLARIRDIYHENGNIGFATRLDVPRCYHMESGDSGGPAFNRNGEIIGILSGGGTPDGIWYYYEAANVTNPKIADFINLVLSLKNPAACNVPWYLEFMMSHKDGKVTTIRKN